METLIDYACGANWAISCASLAAFSQREDGASAAKSLLDRLKETGGWEVYYALAYVAKLPVRPPVGSVCCGPRRIGGKHDGPVVFCGPF